MRYDVAVIGAGLSGLSAAVHLVKENKKVLVLESNTVLGGRTSSWKDHGMEIESGLHRYLGFYEKLPELLKSVDVDIDSIINWTDTIYFRMAEPRIESRFTISLGEKPLETIKDVFTNNDYLDLSQKLALSRFLVNGFRQYSGDKMELDKYTVDEYAREQGVDWQTITRILVPLTEGLFFLSINEYSALHFFALFAPYVTKIHTTRVGAFTGGMTEVMITPLANFITKNGGDIKTNVKIKKILVADNKVLGVASKSQTYQARSVIIATPLTSTQKIITESFFSPPKFFSDMLSLTSMPSISLQIELSRPALKHPNVVFSPETSLSSYAEESTTTFPNSAGRLSVIVSDPSTYMLVSDEKIFEVVLKDARKLGLSLTKKTVRDYRVVRWEDDFYSYKKGTYRCRPDHKTSVQGLYLAGDYTNQQYLQTMEGAVYSGELAANALLGKK